MPRLSQNVPLKIHSLLEINSFQLPLNIGLKQKERLKSQKIIFDLRIYFLKPPKVYKTHSLDDSVCYTHICDRIRNLTKGQTFVLIENLCHHVWKNIKTTLPRYCLLRLKVTKISPPSIPQAKKGISYTINGY